MKLLHRLRNAYLNTSAHTFPRMAKVYDHCPHCDQKTPWMARAISGFARCLQCGKDPLTRDVGSAEQTSAEDAPRVAA